MAPPVDTSNPYVERQQTDITAAITDLRNDGSLLKTLINIDCHHRNCEPGTDIYIPVLPLYSATSYVQFGPRLIQVNRLTPHLIIWTDIVARPS